MKDKDYFCPKCNRHMLFHTTNLHGERVYACPVDKHMYIEKQLTEREVNDEKRRML